MGKYKSKSYIEIFGLSTCVHTIRLTTLWMVLLVVWTRTIYYPIKFVHNFYIDPCYRFDPNLKCISRNQAKFLVPYNTISKRVNYVIVSEKLEQSKPQLSPHFWGARKETYNRGHSQKQRTPKINGHWSSCEVKKFLQHTIYKFSNLLKTAIHKSYS